MGRFCGVRCQRVLIMFAELALLLRDNEKDLWASDKSSMGHLCGLSCQCQCVLGMFAMMA